VSEPEFLTLDEVLGIHADQIRRYGGAAGIRDLELLQSALAMPQTTFDDEFLHGTLFEMAAAYLFHLARNHPFVDGNKRTALMCALVFLGLAGGRSRCRVRDSRRRCIGWCGQGGSRGVSARALCREIVTAGSMA
jgi:death-on-curing family protein